MSLKKYRIVCINTSKVQIAKTYRGRGNVIDLMKRWKCCIGSSQLSRIESLLRGRRGGRRGNRRGDGVSRRDSRSRARSRSSRWKSRRARARRGWKHLIINTKQSAKGSYQKIKSLQMKEQQNGGKALNAQEVEEVQQAELPNVQANFDTGGHLM